MVAFVIRIDRLEIDTSGIPEETIRQTITGFEKAMSIQVMEALRNNDLNAIDSSPDKLDAGNLYLHEKDIHSNQLGKMIAERIVNSIVSARGEESL
jgi:hypothetical protein